MNTQESNKLIAQFMGHDINYGYPENSKTDRVLFVNSVIDVNKLKYNTSWNWLMPAVEKIESLNNGEYDVAIIQDGTLITKWKTQDIFINISKGTISFKTKIEYTYKAVVEFINWYNQNK